MAELKEPAMSRPMPELTEEEKLMREIAKLQAKLAEKQANRAKITVIDRTK